MSRFTSNASLRNDPAAEPVTEPVQFDELAQSLLHAIRRANLELARRYMADIGERHAIRPGVLGVLMVTAANPGIGQVDIACQLGLDKANAAELIRNLEGCQWIARKRSTKDRRRQGVFLTVLGAERLSAIRRDTRAFEQSVFAGFTEQERELLLKLLKRIAFPDGEASSIGFGRSRRRPHEAEKPQNVAELPAAPAQPTDRSSASSD